MTEGIGLKNYSNKVLGKKIKNFTSDHKDSNHKRICE